MTATCVSISDLAEKTGLSYGYISNLISGSKKSEKGLSAIIRALGMERILGTAPEAAAAQGEPGKDAE